MSRSKNQGSFPVRARSAGLSMPQGEAVEPSAVKETVKGVLWGIGATAATGIALLILATAIACVLPDPSAYIAPLALLALMPSMFSGGFTATKRLGGSPILCGVLTGGAVTVASMLLCLVLRALPSSHYTFMQSAALHFAAVAFSILGALAGNIKRKPRRRKRRFK